MGDNFFATSSAADGVCEPAIMNRRVDKSWLTVEIVLVAVGKIDFQGKTGRLQQIFAT